MKRVWLIGMVAGVHVLAFGAVALLQGCGTLREDPPPPDPPPMPTRPAEPLEPVTPVTPRPPEPPPPEPAPRLTTSTYEVRPGDTLSQIARRFGVSVSRLVSLNALTDPDAIRAGQKLIVPGEVDVDAPPSPAPQRPAPTPAPAPDVVGGPEHVVQPGETLSHIALEYQVSVQDIQEANQLTGDRILVGQQLVIPDATAPSPPPREEAPARPEPVREPAQPVAPEPEAVREVPDADDAGDAGGHPTYTVQPGDTLRAIAMNHAVSVTELRRLNRLPDNAQVEPGDRLKIPMFD